MKKKLNLTELRLLTLDRALNGIVICDLQCKILSVNQNLVLMWGYETKLEIENKTMNNFFENKDQYSLFERALESRGYWTGEIKILGKFELISELNCTTNIVYDDNLEPACIVSFFTEKESEIVLRELSRQAEMLYHQNRELVEQNQELDTEKTILEFENKELSNFVNDKHKPNIGAMEELSQQAQELDNQNKTLTQINQELQHALAKVKTLSGFLPICANCKKIRDDTGYWNQIELYIKDHSEAEFSHGLCPPCTQELYGDFLDDNET